MVIIFFFFFQYRSQKDWAKTCEILPNAFFRVKFINLFAERKGEKYCKTVPGLQKITGDKYEADKCWCPTM